MFDFEKPDCFLINSEGVKGVNIINRISIFLRLNYIDTGFIDVYQGVSSFIDAELIISCCHLV